MKSRMSMMADLSLRKEILTAVFDGLATAAVAPARGSPGSA